MRETHREIRVGHREAVVEANGGSGSPSEFVVTAARVREQGDLASDEILEHVTTPSKVRNDLPLGQGREVAVGVAVRTDLEPRVPQFENLRRRQRPARARSVPDPICIGSRRSERARDDEEGRLKRFPQ
jgi:hypothetical protein